MVLHTALAFLINCDKTSLPFNNKILRVKKFPPLSASHLAINKQMCVVVQHNRSHFSPLKQRQHTFEFLEICSSWDTSSLLLEKRMTSPNGPQTNNSPASSPACTGWYPLRSDVSQLLTTEFLQIPHSGTPVKFSFTVCAMQQRGQEVEEFMVEQRQFWQCDNMCRWYKQSHRGGSTGCQPVLFTALTFPYSILQFREINRSAASWRNFAACMACSMNFTSMAFVMSLRERTVNLIEIKMG